MTPRYLTVHVALPLQLYEELNRRATAHKVPLSTYVRTMLLAHEGMPHDASLLVEPEPAPVPANHLGHTLKGK